MSSHADTIRRSIMCSLYNTGRTIKGKPYSHDDYDAAHASLDALLADKEEMSRICDKWEREYAALLAENQRLREREETVRGNLYLYSIGELEAVEAVIAIREALAGDAE